MRSIILTGVTQRCVMVATELQLSTCDTGSA